MRWVNSKGHLRVFYGRVYLPHVHYTIFVRKIDPKKFPTYHAYVQTLGRGSCAVYLPQYISPGMLAHEIVHVLQLICDDRGIEFTEEKEHTAYIMSHVMGSILGYAQKDHAP